MGSRKSGPVMAVTVMVATVIAALLYASNWMRSKVGVIKGDKPEMTLDIRTLRKDIMSAVATGALSGVPMPLSSGTLASLSAAVAHGCGGGDLGELPKFLRDSMVQNFE